VGFATFAELHRDSIGRVNFEVVVDAPAEGRAEQAVAEKLWGENVGDAFDVIAGASMAFHADSQSAHFLDPAPNLLSIYADFFGDFFSADDDGGILGEECEQRVDAAVGCARQSRPTFGGHRGLERILERRRGDKRDTGVTR
jgi:hypothetical protein